MTPPFLFLYFFLFIILVLLYISNKRRPVHLPPGPNKLPLIGNLHQLGDSPHKSLHILSLKHGPIMFLQLGSVPTLVISSANLAKQIFKTHDLVFSGRPILYAAKKMSYNLSNISFAPYGEYWREVRKITVLELLSSKRVASFTAIRSEEVTQMISNIARSSSNPVNLSELALSLANNVICRATFGHKGENSNFKVHDILEETQALLGEGNLADFFPWMWWLNKLNGVEKRLDKNFNELDELYDKVIADHRDPDRPKPNQDDLVDVLLRIQKDQSHGINLSDEQIKGILTDMFIAGTDTTAATIVWIMAELIKNPSAMKKAQEEVRNHINQKQKSLKEEDVSELVYLKSVVKEALRLHPPAPLLVPRETTEDCVIGRYAIQAKTRVFINAKSIGVDPKHWEDPEEFKPERFVKMGFDFEGGFEMVPFGSGRRGCPGSNFATRLSEYAVASLLYEFDWSLPEGMRREDVDMEESVGITVHKKNPLFLLPAAR